MSAEPNQAAPEILSLSGQRWLLRETDERLAQALRQRHELPDAIARLMAARGISLDDAAKFLNPRLRDCLPDPLQLKDMERAATRLAQAVMKGEQIAIFGDYDVDGATSSALLHEVLNSMGLQPFIHIPDRMKEGYGPNAPALLALGARGAKLILTVDCGTVAFAPLAIAADEGIDVIVVDHHQGEPELPRAYAVVNPNRADEPTNPCQQMAAVGVSFLLLVATVKHLRHAGWFNEARPEPNLLLWLDLVALGTVCDVMPLTGANRALVAQGLRQLATRSNLGLKFLADKAGLADVPGAYHLGFIYGPRINAGGRVGKSDLGVRLMTTRDEALATQIVEELENHNGERKALESLALEEAIAQAEAKLAQFPAIPLLLLHAEGWHPGVIGIVAGRIKDRFGLPTMILAREGELAKASCRSIGGVDIGAAVAAAKGAGLLLGGGGHAMAAGFSVEAAKLAELEAFFALRWERIVQEAQANRSLKLDGMLGLGGINVAFAEQLAQLAPYGQGHPTPRWWIPSAMLLKADIVGTQHVRLILGDGDVGGRASGQRIKAMVWRAAEQPMGQNLLASAGKRFHLAATIQLNHWNGNTNAELVVEDAAQA